MKYAQRSLKGKTKYLYEILVGLDEENSDLAYMKH